MASGVVRLVVTDPAGRQVPLEGGRTYVIGSGPEAGIRITDSAVLPRHAAITVTPRGAWIEDLGTVAGTYVNSIRVAQPVGLRPGDGVTVGRHTLRVSVDPTPPATPPSGVARVPVPERALWTAPPWATPGWTPSESGAMVPVSDSETTVESGSLPAVAPKSGVESYRAVYEQARVTSEERWYQRAFMVAYALRVTRLRFFLPFLVAGAASALVSALPGEVRVDPEAFSVLAASIPALAIAVFVVVERRVPARAPGEDEETKHTRWRARGEGLAIGAQIALGELLAVWAVAASSTNLVLLAMAGSVALTQIIYLTSYTFGFADEVDFDPGPRRR